MVEQLKEEAASDRTPPLPPLVSSSEMKPPLLKKHKKTNMKSQNDTRLQKQHDSASTSLCRFSFWALLIGNDAEIQTFIKPTWIVLFLRELLH